MYRENRRRGCSWVVLGAVILVLTLVGLGYYHLNLSNYVHWGNTPVSKTINLPRQTLQVIAVPQLVVKNFAGILIIHTGDSNIVRISAAEQISGSSSPDDIQYTVTQNRNTVEVEAQKNGTFSTGNLSVDLDITLPSQSIIQATLGAGNISIDGISGLISVQTGSGNVDFKNGTVQKNTSFQANAGSITFSGKLAPNGNYEFKGNTGSIDITLPANSAFILDASTQVGNVSNAFRSILVGHNPTSQLHVHVDVGSISIHQGQSGGATEQSSCQRC